MPIFLRRTFPFQRLVRLVAPFFFLVELTMCSGNGMEVSQAETSHATLKIGPLLLAEFSANGELLHSAPRVVDDPVTAPGYEVSPNLIYRIEKRVVASTTALPYRASETRSTPYKPLTESCPLNETLTEVTAFLEKAAQKENATTVIPEKLRAIESCALRDLLTCFLHDLKLENIDAQDQLQKGISLQTIVEKLGHCSHDSSIWEDAPYAVIVDDQLHFYPENVCSLQIFEGVHTSYNETATAFDSLARVLGDNCRSVRHHSPIALKTLQSCNGCAPLASGKVYTVFLQTSEGAADDDFKVVSLKIP